MTPLQTYLVNIERELQQGNSTEHTHRPYLKTLIETLYPSTLATNEPKRIKCGAPDYIITKEQIPLGHIEAKDIGLSLAQIESDAEKTKPKTREGEQLKRYRESLPNLILTDYLDFRWYVKGKKELAGCLATVKDKKKLLLNKDGAEQVKRILQSFMQAETPTVTSPRELAARMAGIAKLIRITIEHVFEDKEEDPGSLQSQFESFKQVLNPDLTPQVFADRYAQTISYGIFAARCNHTTGTFTRRDVIHDIPKTNPFLLKMFNYIAGIDLDERINWAVDSLAELLNRADIDAILKDFGKRTRQEDPIVHFYETFLSEYDQTMKEKRGVFYTPEPVVSYIVRSVDSLLKTSFHLSDGLADTSKIQGKTADGKIVSEAHRVQILDPATGTGTFLHSVIDLIHESFAGNSGMWSSYVPRHLLPRIYGLELLMAPYVVAHMKLDLQLKNTGYDFKSNERLRIYLTNTLEESYEGGRIPFAEWLVEEATAASYVKYDVPVMVILGNPPYAGEAANTGKWIKNLLHGKDIQTGEVTGNYFEVDGKPLGEKNPKWVNNDYVKFIRFSQWRIERTGYGILAFITDNSYLRSPTLRGMRESLLQTFDEIYILDLHGNSKKQEQNPDDTKDVNVFDITQGVAIGIFIKHSQQKKEASTLGQVRHADLWGTRVTKYQYLSEKDVSATEWQPLQPQSPYYLFVPQENLSKAEYEQGWKVTDIFPVHSIGIATARDPLTIHFSKEEVWNTINKFVALPSEEARTVFKLGDDADDWKVALAQRDVKASGPSRDKLVPILYRPFDVRYTYYTGKTKGFHCRPRREVMHHMLAGENVGLSTTRSIEIGRGWEHIFCTSQLTQLHTVSIKEVNYLFPLYLYPDRFVPTLFDTKEPTSNTPSNRQPNIAPTFITELAEKLTLQFVPNGKGNLQKTFGPEDIFNYLYAIFHSPTYRRRYMEFLKDDFPRLPLTSQINLFRALCSLGGDLVALHLMQKKPSGIPNFNISGNDTIDTVRYTEPGEDTEQGRVYINKEQYFEGIPLEVWEFEIGGYQICERWLKDRKSKRPKLEYDDIRHYQQIVAALADTMRLMGEIDSTIIEYGGWPIE